MKPDKHKKEKNAAYKKKHGISDDGKYNRTTDQQRTGSASGQGTQGQGQGRHIQPDRSEVQDKERKTKEGTSAGAISEIAEVKSFQRRKLVSNWERYEPEENEAQTLRGSDFTTLVRSSANVLSHFQYCAELDSTEEKPNTYTKFLNLDCDDLANSLMCVPLHERLAIDASVFEPNLLECLVEMAEENLRNYSDVKDQLSQEPVVSSSDHLNEEHFGIQTVMAETKTKPDDPLDATPPVKPHTTDSDDVQDVNPLTEEICHSSLQEQPMVSDPTQNVGQDGANSEKCKRLQNHHLDESKKAVDSTTVTTSKETVKTKYVTQNKQTLKELENELDLLLNL